MWFAQYQSDEGKPWVRLGSRSWPTQERAKATCKQFLGDHPALCQTAVFRTVADDGNATIYQECRPPHGWRLVWRDVPWPARAETGLVVEGAT